MEIHLEMKAQELMEEGMTEREARAAARRQFGNLTLQQEEGQRVWIARWVSDLGQDIVYALRTLRRQPGFATVAVLSAALGIGACSLIFGIANFALFRSPAVDRPGRLASISGKSLRRGRAGGSLAYPDFEDLRQARSFQDMAAFFQFLPATIASGGEPQRYWGSIVTSNYFDVVRPAFALGRGFDTASGGPVVVLSYQLWRSRFAGDRAVVGREIELNGRKVTVVGVTGPGFRGTEVMFFSDFWLPFSMLDTLSQVGMSGDRLHDRGGQWLLAVGRLRDDVSVQSAAAELEVIGKRLAAAYPETNQDRLFHAELAGQINPGIRKMVLGFFVLLLCVAIMVLCTACANVANLLLARASARQKEIATRLAIGAGRGRLVRQLLTESLILSAIGGIAGLVIAQIGASAIGRSRIPLSLPVDFSLTLDYGVLLFSIALSVLTGVVFGLAPALRATRPNLSSPLKDERIAIGQSRRFGMRNLLVVAQVSICMVLLICSGLFLRSLYSAANIDPGFARRNLLLMSFDPSLNRYSTVETRRIVDRILETARAMPGVESASLGDTVPLNMEGTQNAFAPDDNSTQVPIRADVYSVAPQYFDTLGIRMLEGEDFRNGSSDDVVIVNQAASEKAFPHQNPIGRRISYLGRRVRITGVVVTTKSRTIGEEPHPCLYFPMVRAARGNDSLTGMTLILRTRGEPAAFTPQMRLAIRDIDPTLAVFDVRTMEMQLAQALFLPRATALLFGLAGLMGLLISTVGIYGVVSFSVARQTREIGIRMAMGARRGQVLGMVLWEGLLLTVAGAGIGLGLAVALGRMAASLLYGVSPTDTLTFVVVPALLVCVALAACLVPARRAAALDPVHALRYE
jgi:predicted permease